jgi:non-ribosomal peptide synthetase component F/thioesterase domain-containing protein
MAAGALSGSPATQLTPGYQSHEAGSARTEQRPPAGPGSFPQSWLDIPIFSLFQDVAARHHARIAISDRSTRLTYGEVAAIASQLAGAIAERVPQDGAVGVLLPNAAWYPVALLGGLASGRMVLVLDAHYPADRSADIIADARLSALVVDSEAADNPGAAAPNLPVIDIAACRALVHEGAASPPLAPPRPAADPALIIYTSGSSGRPKGVVNSQSAILHRACYYTLACGITEQDRFCSLSSLSTIAGIREQITALLAGSRLHVLDVQRTGLREIRGALRDEQITLIYAVPTLLRTILQDEEAGPELAALRNVRVGGDVVLWNEVASLRRVLSPSCTIQIGFSSTEAPGAQWFVPRDYPVEGPSVPIGYALPGIGFSLLDDDGQEVGPGEVGEIVLRSRFLALGHWREGALIPGPFEQDPEDPAARILHTGDLGRCEAEGLYVAAGRKDRQVKIRGQRVEPAELESLLLSLPRVADAAVIVNRSPDSAASLVAFLIPQAGAGEDIAHEARAAIAASLPSAMQPASIHLLHSIPRLPSSKPDVRALTSLHEQRLAEQRPPTDRRRPAPSRTRRLVSRVWSRSLGQRADPECCTWLEAGGDSLKLLHFVLQLEQAFKVELPFELFNGDMRIGDVVSTIEQRIAAQDSERTDLCRPLVFLAPGIDGDEPRLAAFRTECADALRFVVLRYPNPADSTDPLHTFERIVDSVCDQIERAAGTGTVRLAGYSFGGLVAYGAAQRMSRSGRAVDFLGILDTDLLARWELARTGERTRLSRREQLAAEIRDRGWLSGLLLKPFLRPRLRRYLRLPFVWIGFSRNSRALFLLQRKIRIVLRWDAGKTWLRQLEPSRLAVRSVLFRSEAYPPETPADLGWSALIGRLNVVNVRGTHDSMLDQPYSAELAAAFQKALEAVTSGTGPVPTREAAGVDPVEADTWRVPTEP